jgi:hypothetical protein
MKRNNLTLNFQVAGALKTVFSLVLLMSISNLQAQPGRGNHQNNRSSNGGGGGNCLPTVSATFSADDLSVTTNSSKDLSNVVLEFCDGLRQKYDGLSGKSKTFTGTDSNAGKLIKGVWIKSGCNSSGDGPGFGEYVANPDEFACNPVPPSCYAWEVVTYKPGKRYDGSDVRAERSIPERALGEPEKSDAVVAEANVNFVALGFGGELVIKFQYPIKNGPGADVKVWETTYPGNTGNCVTYPETINAFASQDGCNWEFIGGGCQDTELDLGLLSWAQYIKLIDVSPKAPFANVGHITDGYDVDGIECLNGAEQNPVIETSSCEFASQLIAYNPKLRKDGQPVLDARQDANNALGEPQRVDEGINFASLGFGGSIIIGFNCVIFDKPGDDIEIAETSFGSPSCTSYPEKARVEGSLDLLFWEVLAEEICQDAFIDLAGKGPIKYLKITDISDATKFSGGQTTDGYDVDGVVVLQPGCSGPARMAENAITQSTSSTKLYPNPVSELLTMNFTTGDAREQISVRVFNTMGQLIMAEDFSAERTAEVTKNINLSAVVTGVYFISVERNNQRETFQIVKQ